MYAYREKRATGSASGVWSERPCTVSKAENERRGLADEELSIPNGVPNGIATMLLLLSAWCLMARSTLSAAEAARPKCESACVLVLTSSVVAYSS